jgi:hypothetical protein
MKRGICNLIVNGEDQGEVQFSYDASGRGHLKSEAPETFMLAFDEPSVAIRFGGEDRPIHITNANPGQPAAFAFTDLQKRV